ncbi:diaminopimelate decarboxylase family protein [Prescottella subtropica]|uniref:diaminopimelate decarboxylase family protein n=1 Tax=Prescottella subtropica TaxID=2545757 RepID=UPI0010F45154|nr:diaminopimelate decarboxylase [Prescottella subtropica]
MTLLDLFPSLRAAMVPRLDPALWPVTTGHDDRGRITVGGVALDDIADEYGTPTYVLDEDDVRHRCRTYRSAFPDGEIAYAAQALMTRGVADWVTGEGLALAVGSVGDLAIARAAGIDPRRIVFRGNATTASDLRTAVAAGVGRIVVGTHTEIRLLASVVPGRRQVLVRATPDTDVAAAARLVVEQPRLDPVGLHCRLGSRITDSDVYATAVADLIGQMEQIRRDHGIVLTRLDLGGGHAVPYRSGDPHLDPADLARAVDDALDDACARNRFPRPTLILEPGRGVVARAGVTLYRVVSVETGRDGTTFVTVDGGVGDHPQVSMSDARYDVVVANRHPVAVGIPATVLGRHGDAGDVLARDVPLPEDLHPGDVLAVPCTGAYHHALASSYGGFGRPPIVAVRGGVSRPLIRRETAADLLAREVGVRHPFR